jgi:hypothetical protein
MVDTVIEKIWRENDYRCVCKYKVEIDGHARVIGKCVCTAYKKQKAKEFLTPNNVKD